MDMREILDLLDESEELLEVNDSFDIELGEDLLIETGVVDLLEDGVVLEADEDTLKLLEEYGITFEEDWSKYDEPTINRIKKGITKPVDKTDYNVPTFMRKAAGEQPKTGFDKRKVSLIKQGILKANEEEVEESGLQAYLGKKKYGEEGMKALQKAGREGASKEKMAKIRAQHDKLDEVEMDEAKYQGREVPLGKPMAGDVKKSKVYVKKPNGKVVKVNFGDKKMKIKKSNPKRRKSFRARHNCKNPGPRWKARYWSCRAW